MHQRSVLVGAGAADKLRGCVDRLVGLVKSGGWIELLEADLTDPGAGEKAAGNGPAVEEFLSLLRAILDGPAGVGHAYSAGMKSWLEAAGLEKVQEKTYIVPFGAACRNEDMVECSVASLRMTVEGLRSSLSSKSPNMSFSFTPNRIFDSSSCIPG